MKQRHSRRLLAAIAAIGALATGLPGYAQMTPSSVVRTVEIEREYVSLVLPPGYTLAVLGLLDPAYAYFWPALQGQQTSSSAPGAFDESLELVEAAPATGGQAQTVSMEAMQVSAITGSGISISGEVRCEPGVLFDEGGPLPGTILIVGRCRATSELDVRFTIDAPTHFDLSATLQQQETTGVMLSSVRLRTGAGAAVATLLPIDCVDLNPPFMIEYGCAPTLQSVSDVLPAGDYWLRVIVESDAAAEDFYCDEFEGCWPGWAEYGWSVYQADLSLSPAALPGLGHWGRGALITLLGLGATVALLALPSRGAADRRL